MRSTRWARWAICALAFLTPLPALWWGYVGYAASTAVAVIGLYIAFVLPIILRLRAGESFERGAWHLGKHYKWIDAVAVAWIGLICVLFLMPVYVNPSLLETMSSALRKRMQGKACFNFTVIEADTTAI